MRADVAIIGSGAITGAGEALAPTMGALRAGQSALRALERRQGFASEVELTGRDGDAAAAWSSRVMAFALRAAAEAIAAARALFDLDSIHPDRIAVVGGTSAGVRSQWDASGRAARSPYMAAEGVERLAAIAQVVADANDWTGPIVCANTACTSGASAVVVACGLLASGDVDAVCVVGAEELTENAILGFESMGAYNPGPCSPFKQSGGLSLGEGACAHVLVRASDVPDADAIGAIIVGWGLSSDAYHPTRPDPDAGGWLRAFDDALAMAEVAATEVGYLNLHGTGTQLNDACERRALSERYPPQGVPGPVVSSTKGALGHMLGAAGTVELAVAVDVVASGVAIPTAGPGDARPFDDTAAVHATAPGALVTGGVAMSMNSAFGGHNSALCVDADRDRIRRAAASPGAVRPRPPLAVGSIATCGDSTSWPAWAVSSGDGAERPDGVGVVEWRRMDRLTRMALTVSSTALRDPAPDLDRWGLVYATDRGPAAVHARIIDETSATGIHPAVFAQVTFSFCPGALAQTLGLQGPLVSVTTGRTGGAGAVVVAAGLIESGRVDHVLVVAADTDDPYSAANPKFLGSPNLRNAAAAVTLHKTWTSECVGTMAVPVLRRRRTLRGWRGLADPNAMDRVIRDLERTRRLPVEPDRAVVVDVRGHSGPETNLNAVLGEVGAASALFGTAYLAHGGSGVFVGDDPSGDITAYAFESRAGGTT